MYKYFKELEKPNDYTLQLVDTRDFSSKNNIKVSSLPLEFYAKHRSLFEIVNDLKFILKNCNFEDMAKFIPIGNIELYSQLKIFYEEDRIFLLSNSEELIASPNRLLNDLKDYKKFVTFLYQIDYYEKKQTWEKSLSLFDSALTDIKEYNLSFKNTKRNQSKSVALALPNAWYLTSYGDLYNTGCGHAQTNLETEITKIEEMNLRNISALTKEKEKYLKLKKEIIERGYVTAADYNIYLHIGYGFASFDAGYLKKCHDPKIIKTIYGVVSAHAGFYNFFEKFSKYTNNPNQEKEKLKKLTYNATDDLLVRAAGFSKMGCCNRKTIVTSDFNFINDFDEYLSRGWDIKYYDPLVINREKGKIEELDSLIIKRQLDKQINDYEKNKEPGYGKIF